MAVFTGYVALGYGITNAGVFQEMTTYTRGTLNLSGNAQAGLTQSLSQITGPTGPAGTEVTLGAIFDALTGGNMLCYWTWPESSFVAVNTNFAAVTLNVVLNSYLQAALNLSSQGGSGASGSIVDQGAQIGTMIGNPMVAGVPLMINGGNLTAAVGGIGGRNLIQGPEYRQDNGVNVLQLDTAGNTTFGAAGAAGGNVSLAGTASAITSTGKLTIAGGGVDLLITVGGVSVGSIGTAGNLILKGTLTTSGTPA